MDDQTQDRMPFIFLIFTFVFTWGLWLPSILTGLGIDLGINAETYTSITVPIGAFAPLLVALTLVIKQKAWQGGWDFFRQALDLKVLIGFMQQLMFLPPSLLVLSY